MKNYFFFFALIVCGVVRAQTYYSFPTDSATWTQVEYGYGTNPPTTGTWHYGLNGDTLINSFTYSKVYVNQGCLGCINPESVFNPQTATYHGAIREDSVKKVWLIKGGNSTEFLLYDFALNVGDTFCFQLEPCGVLCHPVDAVDSILVNGSYRRQIHFQYGGQTEVWIEGIGSIVESWVGYWCYLGNIEWELNCFTQNGASIYGTCNYPTGIKKAIDGTEKIKLFPNPASRSCVIELPVAESFDVHIFDISGRIICSFEAVKEKVNLSCGNFSPGIYEVRAQGNYSSVSSVLVVQ